MSGQKIEPRNEWQAQKWLEKYADGDVVAKYFQVEEA